MKERVVWSPKYGGCLMIQQWIEEQYVTEAGPWESRPGVWQDFTSQEEGTYPEHDAKSKQAVIVMNAYLKLNKLQDKIKSSEARTRALQLMAANIRRKAGMSP